MCLLEPSAFEELCVWHPALRSTLLKSSNKYANLTFFAQLPLLEKAPIEFVEHLVSLTRCSIARP